MFFLSHSHRLSVAWLPGFSDLDHQFPGSSSSFAFLLDTLTSTRQAEWFTGRPFQGRRSAPADLGEMQQRIVPGPGRPNSLFSGPRQNCLNRIGKPVFSNMRFERSAHIIYDHVARLFIGQDTGHRPITSGKLFC
jgi:hypothetical protein